MRILVTALLVLGVATPAQAAERAGADDDRTESCLSAERHLRAMVGLNPDVTERPKANETDAERADREGKELLVARWLDGCEDHWFQTTVSCVTRVRNPNDIDTCMKIERTNDSISTPHRDRKEAAPSKQNPAMAVLFWIFAAACVGGALFVVTRRNLIAAVMGMVGSFLGIAAVYMMLFAGFLSVVQMLVYAGAIMVLFVFVIMILNRPEDEPVAPSGRAGQVLGGVAILYLVARLIMLLIHVQPDGPPPQPQETAVCQGVRPDGETREGYACSFGQNDPTPRSCQQVHGALACRPDTPPDVVLTPAGPNGEKAETTDWGTVRAVGTDLFGPGLFPFEAISILLLIAVVGATAIARPLHSRDDEEAQS